MANYWSLAKDFKKGDAVQRVASSSLAISPFVGHVVSVQGPLGLAEVRFPYGVERVHTANLVRVSTQLVSWLPPTITPGVKTARSEWRTVEVPMGFHRDLAFVWSRSASEVSAYDDLWRKYADRADDHVIRDEIVKFYRFARNLFELRLQQHAIKSAAYWAAANRQYRVTSQEHTARKPGCPKCGTFMKKTTYKMSEGNRVRLFACPKDLFLVRQADLLGPDGQPVEW